MNGKTTEKLLRKMGREYQEFRGKLEKLPANLALEHAFEDLAKRDILFAIKEGTFETAETAGNLLSVLVKGRNRLYGGAIKFASENGRP